MQANTKQPGADALDGFEEKEFMVLMGQSALQRVIDVLNREAEKLERINVMSKVEGGSPIIRTGWLERAKENRMLARELNLYL